MTDRTQTVDLIRQRLAPLSASNIDIEDESHRHAGHAGAREGGHFIVTVTSASFIGKSPLQRHRTVLDLLGDLPSAGIHAVSIVTRLPAETDRPVIA